MLKQVWLDVLRADLAGVDAPLATLSDVVVQAQPSGGLDGAPSRWLPDGVSLRSVLLWVVLGVGVLALGGVAFSLVRQMAAKR